MTSMNMCASPYGFLHAIPLQEGRYMITDHRYGQIMLFYSLVSFSFTVVVKMLNDVHMTLFVKNLAKVIF
jgi:hypothetical protein